MGRKILVEAAHLYQPPRKAPRLPLIQTDLNGKDYTEDGIRECYRPLARGQLFDDLTNPALERLSLDAFGITRQRIAQTDPETAQQIIEALRKNGIGSPDIHPILPFLNDRDKRIVIEAGFLQFIKDTGTKPRFFFGPESALDNATLEIVAEYYEGFICAPWQIQRRDGHPSDNQPVRVMLPNGKILIALPYDRYVANAMAFKGADKIVADDFVDRHVDPAMDYVARRGRETGVRQTASDDQLVVVDTDIETFGLHNEGDRLFITWLLHKTLPERGIEVSSINALEFPADLPEATLNEMTAWSCFHGLQRWHTQCACARGDVSWKEPFTHAMRRLNMQVDNLLDRVLPEFPALLTEDLLGAVSNDGTHSTPKQSLLSAKGSSLTCLTSCGPFFDSPWTSGLINIAFGLQAIQHIHDAGYHDAAAQMQLQFLEGLQAVNYEGKNARELAELMLVA